MSTPEAPTFNDPSTPVPPEDEIRNRCFTCKRKKNLHSMRNCQHVYCPRCFQNLIFTQKICYIQDVDTIRLTCLCGNDDSYIDLTLEQIKESILENMEISEKTNEYTECSLHSGNHYSKFCKTCKTDTCAKCAKLYHKYHDVEDKIKLIKSIRNFINCIPLKYGNLETFISHFNNVTERYKHDLEETCKDTLNTIELVIKNLNSLKIEIAKIAKNCLSKGVILLKIIKALFGTYYLNLENKEDIIDVITLLNLKDISYEFNDLKLNVNNDLKDKIKSLRNTIEDIMNNRKTFLLNQVDYLEIKRIFVPEQTLIGHDSAVRCVIQLRDGNICSGGADHSIRVWKQKDGKFVNIRTINERTGHILTLLQLKDERIASAARSNDTSIRIWELNDERKPLQATLTRHTRRVTCIYQLTNDHLVTASEDSVIYVWEPSDQQIFDVKSTLKEHENGVFALNELQGNKIVSGGGDKTIRIWMKNNNDYNCVQILMKHTNKVSVLCTLRDGKFLSGGDDLLVALWSETNEQYECISSFNAHKAPITSMLQLNDDRIITASKDKCLRIWNLNGKKFIQNDELKEHTEMVFGVCELEDGRIVSCSMDKKIIVWKTDFIKDKTINS